MFGKKNKKLEGQAYIDFYEKKKKETGKTTLGEKARYIKEKAKLKNKLIKSGGK
jgi:hypothetical protein|tara:strand:- start:1955 stop:2116 length:162 start_codon:yes stop_codon:yes gene_type:complete